MFIKNRLNSLCLTTMGVFACLLLAPIAHADAAALRFAPAGGVITSEFGYRQDPFSKTQKFHSGLDIAAPTGTPIYSPEAGNVEFSGVYGGYGNMVLIRHNRPGLYTIYAHCQKSLVTEGQTVKAGEPIGLIGTSGRSTGPHLHFEVHYNNKYMNPVDYLLFLQNESVASGMIDSNSLSTDDQSAPTPLPPAVGGPDKHLTVEMILNQ